MNTSNIFGFEETEKMGLRKGVVFYFNDWIDEKIILSISLFGASVSLVRYFLRISFINACCPLWFPSKTAFTVIFAFVLVQLLVTLSIFLILSFSVIALTLYKDTDLLTLPYPQVTVEMTQKNRETNLNHQLFPCFIAII